MNMYKVLIADDEISVRKLLEKSLRTSGLPIEIVAAAGDGKEAYESSLAHRPDIIVTDIAMPSMNGLELIRSLQEHGITSKNIIISGYDEFDYARTAIALGVTDYLLKPFMPQELFSVFEKIIRELDNQNTLSRNLHMLLKQADQNKLLSRSQALRSLLNGQAPTEDLLFQLDFPRETEHTCYLACIFVLWGTAWNFQQPEHLAEFLKIVQSGYFSQLIRFHAINLEPNKLALCFRADMSDTQRFQDEVIRGIEKLSHSMIQYYDISPYCSLGRICHTIGQIKTSYDDALAAWKETLNPEQRIYLFGEKPKVSLPKTEASEEIKSCKLCIRGAVLNGNLPEAAALLQQLMQLYATISQKGTDYIFVSAGELVYGIADDMEKNGYGRISSDAFPLSNQQIPALSLLEIQKHLESYLQKCCQLVSQGLTLNNSAASVHLIKTYIEEHLEDHTLSIESVAEMVHFSVSYVRQLFKENTGENFNEYLIRKRMEKAGLLLQNTSMKIQDISQQCGYENQRYFASSFKKFYGCTPTEFKSIVTKEHLY